MSLETLLPKLENPEHAPLAADLTALSGLAGADHERFLAVWRTLSIQRRRVEPLLAPADPPARAPVGSAGARDADEQR